MSRMASQVSQGSCVFYGWAYNKSNGSQRYPYTWNRLCGRLCINGSENYVGVPVLK